MFSTAKVNTDGAGARPNPRAKLRLFCFPYAGGAAAGIYHNWAAGLPPLRSAPSPQLLVLNMLEQETFYKQYPALRLMPRASAAGRVSHEILSKVLTMASEDLSSQQSRQNIMNVVLAHLSD
jgi:hypothetical protein